MANISLVAPRQITTVAPAYPATARAARIRGIVIIEAVIDETGTPTNLQVLRGEPMLDEAALAAVRQWRYQPTLFNGVPVRVMMTVTVNFSLQDSAPSPSPTRLGDARAREELSGLPVAGIVVVTNGAENSVRQPLRVGPGVAEPKKIVNVPPVYPRPAREARQRCAGPGDDDGEGEFLAGRLILLGPLVAESANSFATSALQILRSLDAP